MKLFFRLFWMLLTQSRHSRCSILGPVVTSFRVLPNDLDALLHMNNGVYLTMMDLGRTDLLLRSGAAKLVRSRGWYPVLAGETIRFRRSLQLWQKFTITTRVIGWNSKSIYLEQVFNTGDTFIARGVVDARFLVKGGGKVTPAELLKALDIDHDSPVLPEWVSRWEQSNEAARELDSQALEQVA